MGGRRGDFFGTRWHELPCPKPLDCLGTLSEGAFATFKARPTLRLWVHIRRQGGGRRPCTQEDPKLMQALEALVEPTARGDPMSPLRWTCKSVRQLAGELRRHRYDVGPTTVARLLREAGYSLQGNRKTREGGSHPDRNAQFEFINKRVKAFQRRGQPVISVDTKKKELVGDFKNGGREWRPEGEPEEVRVHDFQDPALGQGNPVRRLRLDPQRGMGERRH